MSVLQGSVAGTCSRDQIAEMAQLWKSCRDVFQGHVAETLSLVLALFHSRNMKLVQNFPPATCSTESSLLNFMGHVAGANFAQISCCHTRGCVSPHTRGCVSATCLWNTSRQLFYKCANFAIWSLLHVPATLPCNMSRQCVRNAILSPLHFAATCSCNMSPRVDPPLGKFEKRRPTSFSNLRYDSLYMWQNVIYMAGKSFSVVMWPWFCKWKTLDLPIWRLELIISKIKPKLKIKTF